MGGMKAGFNCCLQRPYYFIKTNYPVKQATAASFQHNGEEMGLPGTVRLNGIDRGPGSLIRLRRAAFYPSSCGERLVPNLYVHVCVFIGGEEGVLSTNLEHGSNLNWLCMCWERITSLLVKVPISVQLSLLQVLTSIFLHLLLQAHFPQSNSNFRVKSKQLLLDTNMSHLFKLRHFCLPETALSMSTWISVWSRSWPQPSLLTKSVDAQGCNPP